MKVFAKTIAARGLSSFVMADANYHAPAMPVNTFINPFAGEEWPVSLNYY